QRRLELADGLLGLSLVLADQSEVVMGLGVVWSQPQGLFKLGGGSRVILKQPVSLTQVEMGFWILGPRLERRLELAPSAQQIPSVSQDHSQRIMDLRPIRPQAQRALIKADGAVQVLAFLERPSHVPIGLGEIGLQSNRLAVFHY